MAIEYSSVDEETPLQTVHIIGQIANSAAGHSVSEQTTEILRRIDVLLAEAGSDRSELIQANVWLSDLGGFGEMNAIWECWLTPGTTPRRTTFEDRNLPDLCDVRIDIIAWRKNQSLASAS